jgi:hypothetical protein
MRVRIPGWLRSMPEVRLNGRKLDSFAAPGSYLAIHRTWKAGDRVELKFPMHLHTESMPDDPGMQAILYGPLVLAGDLGATGLTQSHIIGPNLRVGAPDTEQAESSGPSIEQIMPRVNSQTKLILGLALGILGLGFALLYRNNSATQSARAVPSVAPGGPRPAKSSKESDERSRR